MRNHAEIGRLKHTKEQEQGNKDEYQALLDNLMQKQGSVSNIFNSLQNTLVNYASGGSKNSNVLAMLNSRNLAAIPLALSDGSRAKKLMVVKA